MTVTAHAIVFDGVITCRITTVRSTGRLWRAPESPSPSSRRRRAGLVDPAFERNRVGASEPGAGIALPLCRHRGCRRPGRPFPRRDDLGPGQPAMIDWKAPPRLPCRSRPCGCRLRQARSLIYYGYAQLAQPARIVALAADAAGATRETTCRALFDSGRACAATAHPAVRRVERGARLHFHHTPAGPPA